ncbi:MAG: RuvA C-terminal domain-containing protein [Patescibacteria group bacterium]
MSRRKRKSNLFRFPTSKWWRRGQALADFLGGMIFGLAEQLAGWLIRFFKFFGRVIYWLIIKIPGRKKKDTRQNEIQPEKNLPKETASPLADWPPQAQEAIAALISLGVAKANAGPAIAKARANLGSGASTQDLIREGLKYRRGISEMGAEK